MSRASECPKPSQKPRPISPEALTCKCGSPSLLTGALLAIRSMLAMSYRHQPLSAGRPEEALAYLANTLTNKLLHAPSANLRAAALRGDGELIQAAARLFDRAAANDDKDV